MNEEDEVWLWLSEAGYITNWSIGDDPSEDTYQVNWEKLKAEEPEVYQIMWDAHTAEVDESLAGLVEKGYLDERIADNGEIEYTLTERGKNYAETQKAN